MIVLIITNVILVISLGFVGVGLLVEMAKDSRPLVIKEAKALREYYESKFKDLQEKTEKAEQKYAEYKELYSRELQRSSDRNDIMSKKVELEKQVERLIKDLNSSDDRINDMALENASLKEKIKALEKPASKKPAKKEK